MSNGLGENQPVAVYVHTPGGMVKLDESAVTLAEHGWVTVQAHRRFVDEDRRGPACDPALDCDHVFDLDRCIKCGGVA